MIKKGPLSNKDKEYIASNRDVETTELAKKLNRAKGTVEKYLNALPKKSAHGFDAFARNEKGSTVMTQAASEVGDQYKKTTSSNRTKSCTTSIREAHNPR